jgi:mono/diheme cytochrome c family protein/glucose/arabinose dehydrogenase
MRHSKGIALALVSAAIVAARVTISPQDSWPPSVRKTPEKAPVLSALEEMKTLVLPPGYRIELVASEPLVIDPIAIDFDPDGRLWVLEMPGFMSGPSGENSREPINNVVVLEDRDGDGAMDKRTVFADKLVLPRALKVLDRGVLVGEPPNLWLMSDADADGRADARELVSNTFGRPGGTVEHNSNSLFWGLDNIIYTSEHDWYLRLKHGKFEILPALERGQWGASMDDAGRIYRNVNDAPLFVDYIAAGYYSRNPNLVRTRGLYDPLISREDSTVWPVRQTRGVNRGYRDQFFRPDDSSVTIQGVGSPVIYRGDQLPEELYGNAFISDSTTNLVHRYRIVDDGTGRLHAVDGYAKGEILASWDERFRPVNLLTGPDGTLYVVDMYRGVVQERVYWTEYLRDYVRSRDLERPTGLGRIWRIVHETSRRGGRPSLSKATPAELVQTLSHPNGWWRDTAQRLLVERHAVSVAPQLQRLARESADWKTRVHALWTLDGLDELQRPQIEHALKDPSPEVRAAAIRLSERFLKQEKDPLAAAVLAIANDPSWTVRRQLAASAGELPADVRVESAVRLFGRYVDDQIAVDAIISGLDGREWEALTRLWNGDARTADALSMLAGAIARSGEVGSVQQVISRATAADSADWQGLAMLKGLAAGLPATSAPRGRRGQEKPPVVLPEEPAGLQKLAAAEGEAAALAKSVAARLLWPGKSSPVVEVSPLNAEERARFAAGTEIYNNLCIACHQADGRGREKLAPTLVESRYSAGPDAGAAIRILLSGKEGPVGLMPPLGTALNDDQIASVLTYVRREWGNSGSPVSPEDVREVRGLTRGRSRPWTDAELQIGRGGRGMENPR